MSFVEEKLQALGLDLPPPPKAAGLYRPALLVGNHCWVSGQLPFRNGKLLYTGKLGSNLSIEQGKESARLCILNALAAAQSALGNLDRIERVIRLAAFVACPENFQDHAKVADGASELLTQIFGAHGQPTRISVGASSLPLNSPVEIEILFSIRG
ncbi:MAG: RidA family protein [Deltaproteobacteria bacterium]|nr:RidA family protein [Deltaproteobacteria bacterium]